MVSVQTQQKTERVFMAGLQMLNLLVNGQMLWETRKQILASWSGANFAVVTFLTIHLKYSQWLLIH